MMSDHHDERSWWVIIMSDHDAIVVGDHDERSS
jgi:hypothetical protein